MKKIISNSAVFLSTFLLSFALSLFVLSDANARDKIKTAKEKTEKFAFKVTTPTGLSKGWLLNNKILNENNTVN